MKFALVTWYVAGNYGRVLQAYATQQALLNLGYESEILYTDSKVSNKQRIQQKLKTDGVLKTSIAAAKRLQRSLFDTMSKELTSINNEAMNLFIASRQ